MNSSKTKKILGAIASSFLFSIFFIVIEATITYYQLTEKEKLPWLMYIILTIILLTPVIAMLYNLIVRIIEIRGGEEDEASKY